MDPEERQGGIEFDPIPLGPRARRIDPVGLAAIVIVLGLVAAVVKPWAGTSSVALVQASPTPNASVGRAVASASPSPPASRHQHFVPSPAKILAAIDPHDAWGVRAVVRGPAGPGNPDGPEYTERWARAVENADGSRLALLGSGDESVVALGVTTPTSERPIDIQVWRSTATGGWEWLDVQLLASGSPDGVLLLEPPSNDQVARETWPAGAYRMELVGGTQAGIIDVRLPGRFDRIPQPPTTTPPPLD